MSNKFIFDKTITGDLKGESSWKSPSNIALVKYWGKKDVQIPKNPSLSFTLSNCFTICKIKFSSSNVSNKTDFELYFEGKKEISFENKMKVFFERIKVYCPYLSSLKIIVETNNSFPHSSGIASSASAYSALSLCIMDVEKTIDPSLSSDYFFKKASFWANLIWLSVFLFSRYVKILKKNAPQNAPHEIQIAVTKPLTAYEFSSVGYVHQSGAD